VLRTFEQSGPVPEASQLTTHPQHLNVQVPAPGVAIQARVQRAVGTANEDAEFQIVPRVRGIVVERRKTVVQVGHVAGFRMTLHLQV